MSNNPLFVISKSVAFEAAIFAEVDFVAELLPFEAKCKDLFGEFHFVNLIAFEN